MMIKETIVTSNKVYTPRSNSGWRRFLALGYISSFLLSIFLTACSQTTVNDDTESWDEPESEESSEPAPDDSYMQQQQMLQQQRMRPIRVGPGLR